MSDIQTPAIGSGKAGPGRPKGLANKTTTMLKEAILLAAETVGEDGDGKNGLTGYLCTLARSEPKSFATLLGRVLPLQVTGGDPGDEPVTFKVIFEDGPGKPA